MPGKIRNISLEVQATYHSCRTTPGGKDTFSPTRYIAISARASHYSHNGLARCASSGVGEGVSLADPRTGAKSVTLRAGLVFWKLEFETLNGATLTSLAF